MSKTEKIADLLHQLELKDDEIQALRDEVEEIARQRDDYFRVASDCLQRAERVASEMDKIADIMEARSKKC